MTHNPSSPCITTDLVFVKSGCLGHCRFVSVHSGRAKQKYIDVAET